MIYKITLSIIMFRICISPFIGMGLIWPIDRPAYYNNCYMNSYNLNMLEYIDKNR